MTEYCICGHNKKVHLGVPNGWEWHCRVCYALLIKKGRINGIPRKELMLPMHKFKLDNLKLIEDLAKQKNLV